VPEVKQETFVPEIQESFESEQQVIEPEQQASFEPEIKDNFEAEQEESFSTQQIIEPEPESAPIESPLETEKDFEQEKEEPEERQARDLVEKDLQLTIDTSEDFDEMSTQLNPDAKEFIPISPTRSSNGMMSPPLNPVLNSIAIEDAVVSQSPRKGEYQPMEDLLVPSELDFDNEADARPHEVENGVESPELLNLKESMQQDDKLAQEYKDEAQVFVEEVKQQAGEKYQVLEKSFNEYSNGFQSAIDDPMNRSFYEGRDNGDILTAPTDILNSVQPIPTFEDEQPEADHQVSESEKPEADLAGSHEWGISKPMDSSDNFEAERFVEEIKSGGGDFDKYVDQGLSPTLPEFSMNTIQTVQETIIVDNQSMEQLQADTFITNTSSVNDIEVPQSPEIVQEVEIPETIVEEVSVPELSTPEIAAEIVKEESPKVEAELVAAAGVAALGVVAAATAAIKKSPAASKAKAAPAAKSTTLAAKKAPVKTETKPAPITKPGSAPIRKPAPATTAAAKPAPASATASRPKPATTAAPIRKVASTTGAAPKTTAAPAAAARTTTLAAKKPATSVTAAK
jgi:Ataxin-2 C-terminal region